jgi:hypothetical protein
MHSEKMGFPRGLGICDKKKLKIIFTKLKNKGFKRGFHAYRLGSTVKK